MEIGNQGKDWRAEQLERLRALLGRVVVLPDASWAAARGRFAVRRFAAGAALIRAGEPVTEVGFLTAGLARYYYLTPDGKQFNKSFVGPGEAVSSVSALVSGEPSPFFVAALEPCTGLFIAYSALVELGEADRCWARLIRALLEQLVLKKERREADFLLLSAEQRYTKFLASYGQLAERVPNYHIASYLGITEVALSRIRRRLGLTSPSPD